MCEFISVVKKGERLYYMTDEHLDSPAGQALFIKNKNRDYDGHDFIRQYHGWERNQGEDFEFTNFSSPSNFPAEIVRDLKDGKFRKYFECPQELLSPTANAEFERVTAPARAEFERVTAPARAEFERVTDAAYAEFERVTDAAYAEFERVIDAAFAEFERVTDAAFAEYKRVKDTAFAELRRVTAPARAEFERVTDAAWAEYKQIVREAGWSLFDTPANRAEAWQETK